MVACARRPRRCCSRPGRCRDGTSDARPVDLPCSTLALLTFPLVGALIASRRPGTPSAGSFCAIGLAVRGGGAVRLVRGGHAVTAGSRGGAWAAWLGTVAVPAAAVRDAAAAVPALPRRAPAEPRAGAGPSWLAATAIVAAGGAARRSRPASSIDAQVAGIDNPLGVRRRATALRGVSARRSAWRASWSRPSRCRCASAARAATSACSSSGSRPPRCCSRSAAWSRP